VRSPPAWWDRAWQSSTLYAADSVNTNPARGPTGLNAPAQWPALIIEPDPFAAGQIGHSVP